MNGPALAPGPERRCRPRIFILALGAAILAAYANSLSGPFVFDDGASIADNPTIRDLRAIGTVLSPPVGGLTVSGRPVLNLSFALNYAIGGTVVWGYHALNLGIHLLGGLTLFGIVRRTPPRSTFLAFASALLWALHPLQTEAVTYVVQRAESLMGLFYLLTIYCFIRGVEAGASGQPSFAKASAGEKSARRAPLGWFGLSWLACLFGMGTKEVMVSAPVLVFFYDRTFLAGSMGEAWRRRRSVYLALAGTWVPLVLFVASTGGNRGGSAGFGVGVGWWAYALTQFRAVGHYLRLAVWPRPLVFEYEPFWVTRAREVAPDALGVGLLAAGTLWALRYRPVAGFLGLWCFAILAPTSLVPGTQQMIAEHRMYLPLAALTVAAAALVRARLNLRAGVFLVLALAAGLGAATARRNADYRTELRLWDDTVAKRPNNPYALYGLGVVLARGGRASEAKADYEKALQLKPDYPDVLLNLGNLLFQEGRVQEALAKFEAAVRLQPGSAAAHNNYGNALAAARRPAEALGEFEAALRLRPNFSGAEFNYANLLVADGRAQDAVLHYEKALWLDPGRVDAHTNLGVVLARAGRLPEAIEQFAEAARTQPDSPENHDNFGTALAQAGRLAEAEGEYQAALRLKPDDVRARDGLFRVRRALGGAAGN